MRLLILQTGAAIHSLLYIYIHTYTHITHTYTVLFFSLGWIALSFQAKLITCHIIICGVFLLNLNIFSSVPPLIPLQNRLKEVLGIVFPTQEHWQRP